LNNAAAVFVNDFIESMLKNRGQYKKKGFIGVLYMKHRVFYSTPKEL